VQFIFAINFPFMMALIVFVS